ncbi:MAG TPA: hypothetical protein PKZ76_04545 [Xanthomonadaceae bacterium]|nr:hypothetical protein [Xanthomonadaceae bacterium]
MIEAASRVSGDGNPSILGASAVIDPDFFRSDPRHPQRKPLWYPTGDLLVAGRALWLIQAYGNEIPGSRHGLVVASLGKPVHWPSPHRAGP